MASVIDMIGAFIFGGLLLVTAAKLERFVLGAQQQSNFDARTEQNCMQLGEILEEDVYSAGYNVPKGQRVYLLSSPDTLKFNYDVGNDGTIDSLMVWTGPKPAGSNPHQKYLYRKVDATTVKMNLGLTNLKFAYYDSSGKATTKIDSIVAVKVSLDTESDLWSETPGGSATPKDVLATKIASTDTVYNSVHWEQYIVPSRRHW